MSRRFFASYADRSKARFNPGEDPSVTAPRGTEVRSDLPGDTMGSGLPRIPYFIPRDRSLYTDPEMRKLFPSVAQPEECCSPALLRLWCSKFGLSYRETVAILCEAQGDVNSALYSLEKAGRAAPSFGDYGLVALEMYSPEAFCLLHLSCPSFEATRDDSVLDAIHELVLSAAEIPADTEPARLVDFFVDDWTTENDEPVKKVLKDYDLAVTELVLMPFGDYGAQGFFVKDPVKEDIPNIGCAAAACCIDFRTGVHNAFRFQFERMADTIAEHVTKEAQHFGDTTHLLQQPYWFRPQFSVEEVIRNKEHLFVPMAQIFELRTAVAGHLTGYPANRNVIQMHELVKTQTKLQKYIVDDLRHEQRVTSRERGTSNLKGGGADLWDPSDRSETETQSYGAKTAVSRAVFSSVEMHSRREPELRGLYRNNNF